MNNTGRELYRNQYRIKSARLSNWDYSFNGYYFITICTQNREHYFGEIDIVETRFIASQTQTGEIAKHCWLEIPKHFPYIILDEFVIMPNHIHGILGIERDMNMNRKDTIGCNSRDAINRVSTGGITGQKNPMIYQSISRIIRWYKGRCSFEINKIQKKNIFKWQARFYDHIVRDDNDLERIRQYIINNPMNWNSDELFA